jgi:hypothetical protein
MDTEVTAEKVVLRVDDDEMIHQIGEMEAS